MEKSKKYTQSREIEANKEIQSTEISPRIAYAVCALFVMIIISVPFVQFICRGLPTKWTDDALHSSCYMENALTSNYQQILTEILRSGNEKAIIGNETGWLFYTSDIEHLTHPIDPRSADCILDMKRQLDARGIQLILVPTPLKPMICAHQLNGNFAEGKMLLHPEYISWVEKLEMEGVLVADLMSVLYELNQNVPAYLRMDTHWSPAGMKAAARTLAAIVEEKSTITQNSAYSVIDTTISHRGDIYSMLRLAKEIEWLPMEQVVTETVLDASGFFYSRQKQAEILLLGDSFTNIFSVANMGWGHAAGLAEQLSLLLQCPIDVISRNDGGSYATRQMLQNEMAKGEDRLSGKKVVIWQFAMRELSTGNWQPMEFELGEEQENLQFLTVDEGKVITTEATVVDVATVPHPSTVTYEDHVVAVHLTDIEGYPEKEALVYMLAMRKRQLLLEAKIKPGDRIALTLENWAAHEAVEGAFNRSELETDITLFSDPLWGRLNAKQ